MLACELAVLSIGPSTGLAAGEAVGGQPPVLTVTTRDGVELVRIDLPPDMTWEISWTHSVTGVQVVDAFAWRSGVMYVTDEYAPFLDIAGLGAFAGRGRLLRTPSGGYHLADIDFPLHGNVHNLIIGSERAPSVLVVGDQRFELSRSHPGVHARIEVHSR